MNAAAPVGRGSNQAQTGLIEHPKQMEPTHDGHLGDSIYDEIEKC